MKLQRASTSDEMTIKTVTFDGNATTGAVGDVPIFTVTGDIMIVSFVPVCTTSLTEAGATAEMSLGITTDDDFFIVITEPIDIADNEIWFDATPTLTVEALPSGFQNIILNGDANNILATVTNEAVATGVINFSLRWYALSSNGLVVPA